MRPRSRTCRYERVNALIVGIVLSVLGTANAQDAPATWTDRQKEDFLSTAEMTRVEELDIGVTGSRKVTLELAGRTHDAHVQTVNVTRRKHKIKGQTHWAFRDSYKYNIAAYRLDRMLGLGMVPVSVSRRYKTKNAAVTWWIDNVQMSERERVAQGLRPPEMGPWREQLDRAVVFDRLVYNIDWNMSNVLITDDWDMRLIDFTRAFRTYKQLKEPERLRTIDARLLERLRNLDDRMVEEQLKDVLTGREISSLLARRDAIVELFDQKIATHGVTAVLHGDGLPKGDSGLPTAR